MRSYPTGTCDVCCDGDAFIVDTVDSNNTCDKCYEPTTDELYNALAPDFSPETLYEKAGAVLGAPKSDRVADEDLYFGNDFKQKAKDAAQVLAVTAFLAGFFLAVLLVDNADVARFKISAANYARSIAQ